MDIEIHMKWILVDERIAKRNFVEMKKLQCNIWFIVSGPEIMTEIELWGTLFFCVQSIYRDHAKKGLWGLLGQYHRLYIFTMSRIVNIHLPLHLPCVKALWIYTLKKPTASWHKDWSQWLIGRARDREFEPRWNQPRQNREWLLLY
jgi:hypothetical protein